MGVSSGSSARNSPITVLDKIDMIPLKTHRKGAVMKDHIFWNNVRIYFSSWLDAGEVSSTSLELSIFFMGLGLVSNSTVADSLISPAIGDICLFIWMLQLKRL